MSLWKKGSPNTDDPSHPQCLCKDASSTLNLIYRNELLETVNDAISRLKK